MDAPHTPVMLEEVLDALAPEPGDVIVDGTFGAGGYSRAIVARGARVEALDRDPGAERHAAGLGDAVRLHRANFSALDRVVEGAVDGVVLDIGVSSMQLDDAERGFSFMRDGPLDMRMAGEGVSAADAVNGLQHGDLVRVIGLLGEERHAGRVAAAIGRARDEAPITTTARLAGVVAEAMPRSPKDRIHPATRTFQALRIYVNAELDELAAGLRAAERALRPGGRLVVVTFHSLEDRIVKRFIAERAGGSAGSRHAPPVARVAPTFEPIGKQGRGPGEAEIDANPRARSARLRAARRLDAPARDDAAAPVFDLPPLDALRRTR